MQLTWHGQSCFMLETANDTSVLVDPFIDENHLTEYSSDDLDPDIVAITHGHFDHAAEADRFGGPVIAQPEIVEILNKRGFEDTVKINIGGTYSTQGIDFTMVQAFHSSATPADEGIDPYGGTPAGYIIDDGRTKVYHAGDTGLFGDMKTVIRNVYEPDVGIVPIGDQFTMGPSDAGLAVDWLGVDTALPMHYNTWPVIEQDPNDFREAVSDAEVLTPDVDGTVNI